MALMRLLYRLNNGILVVLNVLLSKPSKFLRLNNELKPKPAHLAHGHIGLRECSFGGLRRWGRRRASFSSSDNVWCNAPHCWCGSRFRYDAKHRRTTAGYITCFSQLTQRKLRSDRICTGGSRRVESSQSGWAKLWRNRLPSSACFGLG
jgi:hypothetical protein